MLTERFDQALQCASDWHRSQTRKKSSVPYVSHLLGVTSLALEYGADEDEAIAALLHDAVEDAGGAPRLAEIRDRFGERVAEIVDHCTDTDQEPKPPWAERKQAYLQRLPSASPSALLVSCCDKLHNVRSIVASLRTDREKTWEMFKGGRDGSLWYYSTLASEYRRLGVRLDLVDELDRAVKLMSDLAG